MAGIAEDHRSRRQVETPDEHGHEHTLLVVLRQFIIDARRNGARRMMLLGDGAEEADGLCHEERCRHALARHVAQAEIELVVHQQIAIQVATHATCRRDVGMDVQSLPVGEDIGHHRHLNVTGNTYFTLDTLLGGCRLLQLVVSRL